MPSENKKGCGNYDINGIGKFISFDQGKTWHYIDRGEFMKIIFQSDRGYISKEEYTSRVKISNTDGETKKKNIRYEYLNGDKKAIYNVYEIRKLDEDFEDPRNYRFNRKFENDTIR